MNQERKRYPRGRVELDVTITSLGREWLGKTVDLSPYGVKIMLEPTLVPLESGTRVELRLPLPGASPMSLAANVERVDLEDGAALTFLQVTEWQFDRLKEFVEARGGIRRTPPPPVTVVVLTGDLDMASAPMMRQKLEEHLNAGEIRMVLDLKGVPYIDSAGLGEVVRAMKRARQIGGDLRLYGLHGEVLRIFELTGLDKAMLVYPTRGEAMASWR